jgi:hypothetical protein
MSCGGNVVVRSSVLRMPKSRNFSPPVGWADGSMARTRIMNRNAPAKTRAAVG